MPHCAIPIRDMPHCAIPIRDMPHCASPSWVAADVASTLLHAAE
eukprot:gene8652-7875_t